MPLSKNGIHPVKALPSFSLDNGIHGPHVLQTFKRPKHPFSSYLNKVCIAVCICYEDVRLKSNRILMVDLQNSCVTWSITERSKFHEVPLVVCAFLNDN